MNEMMILDNNSEFPVNARDVHEKLESKKDYTNWIKSKINKYGFMKGVDFTPSQAKNNPGRGRPTAEYFCTYDMAKELCLVENTAKGREVRQYFIEIEKKFSNRDYMISMTTSEQLLAYAQRQVENERKLKHIVSEVNRVEEIAKQDNDTLTHDQISEIDLLIHNKAKTAGDWKVGSRIKKRIKEEFFEIKGTRTYKEIPRHAFEKAKQIVANFKA